MIPHRVSAAYPSHEATHFAVDQRTQNKVVVVGHQLERKQFNLVNLKCLIKDSLKSFKILLFAKDGCPKVAAVQGMVKPSRFVGARWSWHVRRSPSENQSLAQPTTSSKRPGPFDFSTDPFDFSSQLHHQRDLTRLIS
jgi:hypothetical protein